MFREPQEQPFHLHAAAGVKQWLQLARTQVPQPLEQHVGLMERLAFRHLVEQFEDRALGRRRHERPVPLVPSLLHVAAANQRIACFAVDVQDHVIREQPLRVMEYEPALKVEFQDPARTSVHPVKMDLAQRCRG